MPKVKGDNIRKATFFLMITLFISRLLGFVREMTIASIYGRNITTDAFIAAFTIPDMVFNLLIGGALSSGFMPVFNQYVAKDDEEGAWKAANTFITVTILCILVLNILGVVFSKSLVPLVAIGNTKNLECFELTAKLTKIMFSAVTFTAIAGLTRGILNSYNKFTAPAIGPVLYNIGFILGAIILGKRFGIYGMAIGVVVGAIANFGVQVPSFLKVGKHKFKFEIDLKNEGYRQMLRLMGPAIIGLSINQVSIVVNQNIASVLGAGNITAIRYATRVMLLPLGVFAMSISTTIFPTLNNQIAKNKLNEYKDTLSKGLINVMFITIPATIGMIVLNVPIIRLLFKIGKFTEQDVKITAFALAFYSFGLIGQSAVQIITRGYYALQDTKTPLKVAIFIETFNIVLNILLVKYTNYGVAGIAFSYSFTSIINMIMLYVNLSKRVGGLRTRETLISSMKASIAAIMMGAGALGVSKIVNMKMGYITKISQLVNVGCAITVAIIIYIGVAHLLKMPEVEYTLGIIRKKISK